ncbi:hypothetical protein H6G74_15505 [Nostoc spongiaeforme FACHB-130]|uniref:Uncharacterized protein n=1 Tax=Nostoc spongiaeforme FACHB-130 TaxID=1357510 RepID=A0ABR8FZ83_9NOSO|nr:hypothetical protein [Nostoc spongiaeforme]MBD2595723.1 hypothetical protein [Nostoc spongiaeforme FACHB-130]
MIINETLKASLDPELLQRIQELAKVADESLDTCLEVALWRLIPTLKEVAVTGYKLSGKISEADKVNLLTD